MLTEVLGVVIAFVTIILLLSMVVTGLVQATQSVLRLRARNLKRGVRKLVESYSDAISRGDARAAAAEALNSRRVAIVERVAKPHSTTRKVLGPKVTWANPKDLAAAIHSEMHGGGKSLTAAVPEGDFTVAKIEEDVKKAEPAWSKQFTLYIRLITVAWAILVAAAFQVSAPDLFSALSKDPARVKLINSQSEEVLRDVRAALAEDEYDLVSDDALDQLAVKYPEYKDAIDQAGNAGTSKEQLLQQLADVLPNEKKRPEIVLAYSKLIDEHAQQKTTVATSDRASEFERLSAYGIQFWKNDRFFLTPDDAIDFQSVIGVLFTAILLCFGAPFWFERLRDLIKFKDRASG